MSTERKKLYKTEIVDDNKELDYLNTKINTMEFTEFDRFTITQEVEQRADLISYINYQTVDLWWLICQVNDIQNPFDELPMGRIIEIPSLSQYYRFFNASSKIDEFSEKTFSKKVIK